MFILDTNVISAVRRPERSQQLSEWLLGQREDELFLSVITIGEIARGIRRQEKLNPDFAKDLSTWLGKTELLFQDRILPFTSQEARIWGDLSAKIGHSGADLMIAATAISHDAKVVTRNISDFEPAGVKVINPF